MNRCVREPLKGAEWRKLRSVPWASPTRRAIRFGLSCPVNSPAAIRSSFQNLRPETFRVLVEALEERYRARPFRVVAAEVPPQRTT